MGGTTSARLGPGKAADLVGFRLGSLDLAGALHDPVAALVFCSPQKAALAVINGVLVVRGGVITGFQRRKRWASTIGWQRT